jgi:hypothetical protein
MRSEVRASVVFLSFCLPLLLALPARWLAGPPYVTDDPEPVDYKHWELYIGLVWDITESQHLLLSAGRGIQGSNTLQGYLAYLVTFGPQQVRPKTSEERR